MLTDSGCGGQWWQFLKIRQQWSLQHRLILPFTDNYSVACDAVFSILSTVESPYIFIGAEWRFMCFYQNHVLPKYYSRDIHWDIYQWRKFESFPVCRLIKVPKRANKWWKECKHLINMLLHKVWSVSAVAYAATLKVVQLSINYFHHIVALKSVVMWSKRFLIITGLLTFLNLNSTCSFCLPLYLIDSYLLSVNLRNACYSQDGTESCKAGF